MQFLQDHVEIAELVICSCKALMTNRLQDIEKVAVKPSDAVQHLLKNILFINAIDISSWKSPSSRVLGFLIKKDLLDPSDERNHACTASLIINDQSLNHRGFPI